jgi:hypothetical protein
MAKLYGTLKGNRGEVTRCGSSEIESTIKNFGFAISTHIADRGGGDKDIIEIRIVNLRTNLWTTVFHGSFAEVSDPLRRLQIAAVSGASA